MIPGQVLQPGRGIMFNVWFRHIHLKTHQFFTVRLKI